MSMIAIFGLMLFITGFIVEVAASEELYKLVRHRYPDKSQYNVSYQAVMLTDTCPQTIRTKHTCAIALMGLSFGIVSISLFLDGRLEPCICVAIIGVGAIAYAISVVGVSRKLGY